MSEYNSLFELGAYESSSDAVDSGYPPLFPGMSQSGVWTAPPPPSVGFTGGGTAAQLQTDVDFEPSVVAESLGDRMHSRMVDGVAKHVCTVCLAPFQTDFALHQHAKDTGHQAYKCKCGTGFNKHSALKRHIDTKDAPKSFACTLCYDKFTRKDKLKDHCRHYHKVTDEGLRNLFNSQEARPRAAVLRRHRAPVPLAAASPASAPRLAPALPPVLAPATAGSPLWSLAASTGQQYASLPAGPFVPADALATTTSFVPVTSFDSAADLFTAALGPSEEISGLAGGFLVDETWATGFDETTF